MNAVALQITMVSMNTASDWIRPCSTGCATVAAPAMLGELPSPASHANRPRFTPVSIAAAIPPAKPPASCRIPNAPPMISSIMPGSSVMLTATIASASSV